MRESLRALTFLVAVSWRVSPRALMVVVVQSLLSLAQAAMPMLLGLLVAGLAARHGGQVALAAALIVLLGAAPLAVQMAGISARIALVDAVGDELLARATRAVADTPTLDLYQDGRVTHAIRLLHEQKGVLGGAVNSSLHSVLAIVSPVAVATVALTADLRLGLLLLVSALQVTLTGAVVRMDERAEQASAPPGACAEYLLSLLAEPGPGAELRVVGGQAFLTEAILERTRQWQRPRLHRDVTAGLVMIASSAVYAAVALGVLAWIMTDLSRGHVTLYAATVAVSTATTTHGTFRGIQAGLRELATVGRTVGHLRAVLAAADQESSRRDTSDVPPGDRTRGLTLDRVRVRYPGAQTDALAEVSLTIPPGSVVALVGRNGAGKSTLAQVILGLLTPTEGQVAMDGVPLAALPLTAWHARCTVVVQQHARPELTAREAVAAGDLRAPDREEAVRGALDRAHAHEVIERLPAGLDTQLGSRWPEGVGLSGGQWQRLATARGMMRPHSSLTVLDEPTSALDPHVEDRLLAAYLDTARTRARDGGITVVVTHRLGTAAAADLVVVLDEGRLVECGTHAELMRQPARYAAMFTTQARGFAAGSPPEGR
ncbi:ATP-binding cassette domain-containing protein [Arsenicicoccus dermatophilus]|uniref:ATP-binding cassette domain-containing protein n=1 Tax=Arsenicicoccus dermatophilus TaxID=1076331 RepID=UPI0039173218